MRNLKKLLALVLAMVMTFSLMLTASAVDYEDYPDKDSITAEFDEAVQVLTGLEVMQGDEKGFRPSDKITRAEAAAIIYRVATGDVTDRQTDLYKDYSTFTDVKHDDWFAGYVGYCQNAGYIKGTSPTTFSPYGQVTGYEVLAMILRAVGYGKNNEFTGASWQVNVAALSKQLGVTKDVVAAHMDQTLNMAAPREVVADLVFMTMATVPTVTFTPALAYNDKQSVVSNIYNPTLGQLIFGLFHSTSWQTIDDWGRPGYFWYQDGVWRDNTWLTTANNGFGYVIPADHPLYWAPTSWTNADWAANTVATIGYAPSYETKEQVLECDVADALDIETEKAFRLFVNGTNGGDGTGATAIGAVANNYRIVATDTVTKVGGQGRITEFYNDLSSKWFLDDTGYEDRAVMIDTMLVRIDAKHDAKLDPAGHVITPAQLEVTIYDGNNQGATNNSSSRVLSKGRTNATNWDEYSKGDYILLNAWTHKSATSNPARGTAEQREAAAFQTNKVVGGNNGILYTEGADQLAWIVDNGNDGKAENFQGKQTTIFYNQGKHEVDGTEYKDQIELYLNLAGTTTNTTFTWFLDQFGNLIGIGDAHAVRYGVITAIYAAFGQGESETTGGVKAIASVTYSDGTKGTEYIDKFRVSWGVDTDDPTGSTKGETAATKDPANSVYPTGYRTEPGTTLGTGRPAAAALTGTDLDVTVKGSGNIDTLELVPVYDEAQHPALSVGEMQTQHSAPANMAQSAWLYLAPSTATNANAHFATGDNTTDAFRILYDNMYQFTVADDNSVIATEVAGAYGTTLDTSSIAYMNSNPNFDRMANGVAKDGTGRLYKSLSYLTFTPAALSDALGTGSVDDTPGNNASVQQMVYVDNETEILIRTGARSVAAYTLETLPGDVTISTGAEIDWTDPDNDGRAEYVYISSADIPSLVTYGLFYYNGTGARWNASEGSGTITGYLNGKSETLTFADKGAFDTVNANVNGYFGHLYAVQMEGGEVTGLLHKAYADDAATYDSTPFILMMPDTTAAAKYPLINATGGGLVAAFNTTGPGVVNGTLAMAQSGGTRASVLTAVASANDVLALPVFGLGQQSGNTYTTSTRAVYYRDNLASLAVTGDTVLSYVRESGGNRVTVTTVGTGTTNYWLAPNVEIIGDLDWLNTNRCDVTIVYEEAQARSITQIYISRLQSDITPSDYGTPAFGVGDVTDFSSIPSSSTAAGFKDALESLPTGSVAYNDKNKPNGVTWPKSNPVDVMYFTFTTTAVNQMVSLEIRDSNGDLRYFEAGKVATAKNGFFGVNINPEVSTDNDVNWVGGVGLTAGNYDYTVTVNGVPTHGSFTVTWG